MHALRHSKIANMTRVKIGENSKKNIEIGKNVAKFTPRQKCSKDEITFKVSW
jgi:hypothetical protein